MMQVQIADILALEEVVPLFDQYRVFYGKTSDLEAARRFLSERMINQQSVILLARDAAGKAVGFSQLYPIFSSLSMRKKFILNDLFVLPEARKTGVGAALLDQAKLVARACGAVGLTLSTAVDNHTAQQLYRSNGWEQDKDFISFEFSL